MGFSPFLHNQCEQRLGYCIFINDGYNFVPFCFIKLPYLSCFLIKNFIRKRTSHCCIHIRFFRGTNSIILPSLCTTTHVITRIYQYISSYIFMNPLHKIPYRCITFLNCWVIFIFCYLLKQKWLHI